MISDLNGSLGSRQFLNVANERTCFASCACTFSVSRAQSRSSISLYINHTQPTIPRYAPMKG